MSYVSTSDLTGRFGQVELVQLTNPTDPAATTINAARLADVIDDIDALVTAKLQPRYTVPLASVPRVLRNVACDLVRARLYEDSITDRVAERERAALKLLDDIAAGKLSLGLDDATQPTAPTGGPSFTEPCRVFTARTLADY